MRTITIPADWSYEYIPTWEYDKNGDLEVSNFMCGECQHHNKGACPCIDHRWAHFHRPYFSCDVTTSQHTICRQFVPIYPALKLEWDFLGGFDEWLRLWRKQWHPRKGQDYAPNIPLIQASRAEGREHSDDVYTVPYDDFINCTIMRTEGIHCLDYTHIEMARKSVLGYKWVHEGPGLWIPWENDKYIPLEQ